jgi:hypothetical protein
MATLAHSIRPEAINSGSSTATSTPSSIGSPSRRAVITGRILSGLAVVFLGFDASLKLFQVEAARVSTAELGYPVELLRGIGLLEAILLAVYLFPRTAVFGAILWTGYLGGAVATHLRVDNPLFSHTLFPTYVAALLWLGLWLRDSRLRTLVPWRA